MLSPHPATQDSPTERVEDTTSYTSINNYNDNNSNGKNNSSAIQIIVIIVCLIGTLIIILVIVIVVRRYYKTNRKLSSDDKSDKTEKEVVHNSIYNSVEFTKKGTYENNGANEADSESFYAQVKKAPKTKSGYTNINSNEINHEEAVTDTNTNNTSKQSTDELYAFAT